MCNGLPVIHKVLLQGQRRGELQQSTQKQWEYNMRNTINNHPVSSRFTVHFIHRRLVCWFWVCILFFLRRVHAVLLGKCCNNHIKRLFTTNNYHCWHEHLHQYKKLCFSITSFFFDLCQSYTRSLKCSPAQPPLFEVFSMKHLKKRFEVSRYHWLISC